MRHLIGRGILHFVVIGEACHMAYLCDRKTLCKIPLACQALAGYKGEIMARIFEVRKTIFGFPLPVAGGEILLGAGTLFFEDNAICLRPLDGPPTPLNPNTSYLNFLSLRSGAFFVADDFRSSHKASND